MADLGDLIARLLLDSSQWDQGMKKVSSETEAETTKIEGTFGKIGAAVGAVGAALAGFELGKKVLEFGQDCLEAAGQVAKFRASIVALKGPGEDVEKFVERIDDISDKSPFEFPELAQAAQKMIQLGASMSQVEKTIGGIVDMGTALRLSGSQVAGLADSIARLSSAADPMRTLNQLEREGIPIWEDLAKTLGTTVKQAQEEVKTGAVSTGQVIQALQTNFEQYKGAAIAWQQSWAGSMKAVKEATENVMEEVGNSIKGMLNLVAPLLREGAALIQGVADIWKELPEPLKNATVAFGAVVAALVALGGLLAPIAIAIALIPEGFAAVAAPIGIAILAIAAVTAALVLLGTWISEHWDGITKALTEAWDQLAAIWKGTWDEIAGVLTAVWGVITAAATEWVHSISNAVSIVWDAVKMVWNTVWDGLVAGIKGYWNELLTALSIFDTIMSYLNPFWEPIKAAFKAAWDEISGFVIGAWEKIRDTAGIVWGAITKIVGLEVDAQTAKAKETKKQLDEHAQAMEDYATRLKAAGVSSTADLKLQLGQQEVAIQAVKTTMGAAATSSEDYANAQRDLILLEGKHKKSLEDLNDPLGQNKKAADEATAANKKFEEELTAIAHEMKPIVNTNNDLAVSAGLIKQEYEKLKKEMHDAETGAADLVKNGFDKITPPLTDASKAITKIEGQLINFTGQMGHVTTSTGLAEEALKKFGIASSAVLDDAATKAHAFEESVKNSGLNTTWDQLNAHVKTLEADIRNLTAAEGDHTAELDRLQTELGHTKTEISNLSMTTTEAYHQMGLKTTQEMTDLATNAEKAYQKIAADAGTNSIAAKEAWITKTEETYANLLQQGKTLTEDQKTELAKAKANVQSHLDSLPGMWETTYNGVKTAVGGIFDDMVKGIVTGDLSFGKLVNKMFTDIAETALNAFIAPLKKAVEEFIANTLASLLSGSGLGGVLQSLKDIGSAATSVFSGAAKTGSAVLGAAPGAESLARTGGAAVKAGTDAASTAGTAATSALSSITGIVGAAGAVVSAVSGVISNFQNMHMETSLNAIEHNTRYTMMYVGERADGGILGILFKIDEEVAWGSNTKATENMRDLFKDWSNDVKPWIHDTADATSQALNYLTSIKETDERILARLDDVVAEERNLNVNVTATGATTAEAAKILGNQIAANLARQLVAVK